MSMLEQVGPSSRKVMTLFYLVDASGSMYGDKIGQVNSALEEAVTIDLKNLSGANDDAEIRVAIMQFSTDCQWITPISGPVPVEDLYWNDLTAGGLTALGAACEELDSKMSRNEYLRTLTGAYAPIIILLSDGVPTDNWEAGLARLKSNTWFKYAIKIAIAIGKDADLGVLVQFTGTPEAVLQVNDKRTLKALIHKVTIRSSEFQTHVSTQIGSGLTTPEEDSARIAQDAQQEVTENADSEQTFDDDDWSSWT